MGVRVRFAPSPTGFLHIGGLRTALFNYLHALRNNGDFIIRIEDTDKARTVPGAAEQLLDTLKRCGIVSKEPVQFQSTRRELYLSQAERMIEEGSAYSCFCTPERLSSMRRDSKQTMYDRFCRSLSKDDALQKRNAGIAHTVRLRVPNADVKPWINVQDTLRGKITFPIGTIDDQILLKSDGMPTYHLASVVDDHDMGITHVIRGEEWLPSTPKHILLYEALGWEAPKFTHLPLLLNTDGSKLSKRQGDVAVTDFLDNGFLTSALINFVALLGWSPPGAKIQDLLKEDREEEYKVIFTMPELVDAFSLENVNKSGAAVDIERLKWINSQHIRLMLRDSESSKELVVMVKDLMQTAGIDYSKSSDEEFLLYLRTVVQRVQKLDDFVRLCGHFFKMDVDLGTEIAIQMEKDIWHDDAIEMITVALQILGDIPEDDWTVARIKKNLRKSCKECGVKKKQSMLMMPVRWAISGLPVGAPLPETLFALGKAKTIHRLTFVCS